MRHGSAVAAAVVVVAVRPIATRTVYARAAINAAVRFIHVMTAAAAVAAAAAAAGAAAAAVAWQHPGVEVMHRSVVAAGVCCPAAGMAAALAAATAAALIGLLTTRKCCSDIASLIGCGLSLALLQCIACCLVASPAHRTANSSAACVNCACFASCTPALLIGTAAAT